MSRALGLLKAIDNPNRRQDRRTRYLLQNGSRLSSNDISIIASHIDERTSKENRILIL